MADYVPIMHPWPSKPRPGIPVDFNQSTAADHTIKAAVTGKQLLIVSAELYIAGANVLTFKSGATPDAITGGVFEFGAAGWLTLGTRYGHNIRSREGEALVLTLSQAVKVRGPIWYIEV